MKNFVRLVGIDRAKRPAVLPSQSAELASIIFGSFVAQAPDVVPGSRVDGDASKIIDGMGMPKDNISVSVCVLLAGVHSVSVAVDKGERAALVYPPN